MDPANRCPTEFRYWERSPRVERLRRRCQRLLGFDPALPDDVVRTFAAMRYDADPLAEAFVEEVCAIRGLDEGRRLLDRALRDGVASIPEAPPSLVELFADIEDDPPWVDHELVERGAKAFRRYGTAVFRFAGTITLAAYAESSVAKPLVLTGAYTGDRTRHRFLETAAFWVDVSEPGGMRPGAAGRTAAMRVRIMHVYVRQRLLAHPEWDLEAWGVPINQADALLTLMGGSVAPGLGLRLLGYWASDDDILAMMHFWRYVGHVMGVRPRWYPTTVADALRLGFVSYFAGANAAGDDGRHLCRSYGEAFSPDRATRGFDALLAAWEDGLHRGFTRLFLPPAMHRALDLPPTGAWGLVPLVRGVPRFALEALRHRVPSVDRAVDRAARRSRARWLRRHLPDEAAFRPVQHFTR